MKKKNKKEEGPDPKLTSVLEQFEAQFCKLTSMGGEGIVASELTQSPITQVDLKSYEAFLHFDTALTQLVAQLRHNKSQSPDNPAPVDSTQVIMAASLMFAGNLLRYIRNPGVTSLLHFVVNRSRFSDWYEGPAEDFGVITPSLAVIRSLPSPVQFLENPGAGEEAPKLPSLNEIMGNIQLSCTLADTALSELRKLETLTKDKKSQFQHLFLRASLYQWEYTLMALKAVGVPVTTSVVLSRPLAFLLTLHTIQNQKLGSVIGGVFQKSSKDHTERLQELNEYAKDCYEVLPDNVKARVGVSLFPVDSKPQKKRATTKRTARKTPSRTSNSKKKRSR